MQQTGYSGTPLFRKLGIQSGMRIFLRRPPKGYLELLGPVMIEVQLANSCRGLFDMIQTFVTRRTDLESELLRYKERIVQTGMIWVSWPKKSSGVTTDITEGVIREICLPLQMVDVKVCAVDATWSGLKLVIRKTARK